MPFSENPYNTTEFLSFLQKDCDRLKWVCSWLEKNKIDYAIICAGKLKHILIKFLPKCYDKQKKSNVLLVHYDRIGIGANDNSSCVYQVLNFAKDLAQKNLKHNIKIIFTDGEELSFKGDKINKDKLLLPSILKKNGFSNDNFYCLDSCGRGDTLVISSNGKNCGNVHFQKSFDKFFDETVELAKSLGTNWISLPTSYSDNANFLLLGMKAITITLLPKDEATLYTRAIQKNPKLKNDFLNKENLELEKDKIPLTWKMMHTEEDNFESLWPLSWQIMQKFLNKLY